jgi:hypothetical protein
MDPLQTRLEALEQQMHTVNRRLRWWRGLACGLAVAGLLGWGLPLGLAREDARDKDKDPKGLAQRVAALEQLLTHFSREKNEIVITGANLHIVNGLNATQTTNGLGNLIVGYNEPTRDDTIVRTGSHNVVVGEAHNFHSFGGLVVGLANEIRGEFSTVTGGLGGFAIGRAATVSGGSNNRANGDLSAVSGGAGNRANGAQSVVSGGLDNDADGRFSVVSGGSTNTASGEHSSVSAGFHNTASGEGSSVGGGRFNTANESLAAVSGGQNITQDTEAGWAAGSEADEVVVGNFRSP